MFSMNHNYCAPLNYYYHFTVAEIGLEKFSLKTNELADLGSQPIEPNCRL